MHGHNSACSACYIYILSVTPRPALAQKYSNSNRLPCKIKCQRRFKYELFKNISLFKLSAVSHYGSIFESTYRSEGGPSAYIIFPSMSVSFKTASVLHPEIIANVSTGSANPSLTQVFVQEHL